MKSLDTYCSQTCQRLVTLSTCNSVWGLSLVSGECWVCALGSSGKFWGVKTPSSSHQPWSGGSCRIDTLMGNFEVCSPCSPRGHLWIWTLVAYGFNLFNNVNFNHILLFPVFFTSVWMFPVITSPRNWLWQGSYLRLRCLETDPEIRI